MAVENPATATREVLDASTWRLRRAAHEARVDRWVQPHLERRRQRVAHPVEDFLFTYYSQRPAGLRRWHPGFGVVLEDAEEYAGLKGYAVSTLRWAQDTASSTTDGSTTDMTVSREYVASQERLLRGLHNLLTATASRPAQLGCFGMHEWAMVYKLDPTDVRHSSWPLRLGAEGTDQVVEQHRIACSHFDAFRFFTDEARPRNTLSPGRDDRAEFEQPGCLHAGMDLYKHAFRLSPMVPSELVADCFELAHDIRVLDMRASPYDLSALGYAPVAVETAEGKQEYVAAQRRFAERGAPLRARLVAEVERLLAAL
ncbi:MAG: 3-methyladenine DNA glycosylase [Actinomycetota bacterium]